MEVEVGEEAVIRVSPGLFWMVNILGIQLRFERRCWENTGSCLSREVLGRHVMRSITRIALHRSQPVPATYLGHLGLVKAYGA